MKKLFDNLLISSPNGGGLYFIHEHEVFQLDDFDTTGFSIKERIVLRGIQPSKIHLYDRGNKIAQNTAVFDDIHDVLLDDNFYYLVGTSGNEIFKFNRSTMKEVQRWKFSGEKDSMHINCLANWNGSIVFSAFGEFNEHRGYKGKTKKTGFVQNLHTGHRLITGLSQPHSLASIGQNLLLANSENKELLEYGPAGNLIRTLTLDGYTRGICIVENIIYIGLSCQRNVESLDIANAAVVAIDRSSWVELGIIYLPTSEIYAIQGLTDRDDVIHVLANIASTSSALDLRNGLITKLQAQVTERTEWALSLEQESNERNDLIKQLQAQVTERTEWALSLEQESNERNALIKHLQAEVSERTEWALSLEQESNERNALIESLQNELVEHKNQINNYVQLLVERDLLIKELEDETVRRGEWGLRLDAEIFKLSSDNAELRALLFTLSKSISWKVTLPFREAGRWVLSPIKQSNRYFKGMLRLSKRCYQKLPLGYKTKAAHRNRLAKHFPKLLLASGSHSSTIPLLVLPTVMQVMPEQYENIIDFAKTLKLPVFKKPIVSVIIPIYGQIDYTLRCLASIAENLPQVAFEVIVVDDCSPDNSFKVLRRVNGINLIQNKKNQGFIRSCNAGAKKAKGQYLHFLNNDTQVTPRWLDELLLTFDQFPGTGFVGSKLIYPDGRLQEAGGILWQDGSAWNYGRFQDPQLPVYNYAREVDYCSGASIMVPKGLFDELGGFDEYYLPAYCEDSDLALKIRDMGYRVIYQPLSTVIHYEGITSGTDTSGGIKAYQINNSKKLFERWGKRLQTHQPNGIDVDDAKDRTAKRRVLVLEHCTLTPNEDAGSVTVFNLILLLREMDFQVTFIPEDNFLYMPEHTTALQRVGVEVLYAPYVTSVEQHVKEFGKRYELAFLFRPVVVERHVNTIRNYCENAKVLYYGHDLHFLRMSREAVLFADHAKQIAAHEMKVREYEAISLCDASIVVTDAEFNLLSPELPESNIHVLPLILNMPGTDKSFDQRKDIVFFGGYQHSPNVDAVHFFVDEIMPLVRKYLPGVKFYVVGSKLPADIQALASKDIIITGFIEDLPLFLERMRISVVPLRYGAGIKGKIGTAMAVGLPVVATTIAAEGMYLTHGETAMVAETPEHFAGAIVKLYKDNVLWNEVSQNGMHFSENAWGAEAGWRNLAEILKDLGLPSTRNERALTLYKLIDIKVNK
jgi:GT2 family glycosyltransferase